LAVKLRLTRKGKRKQPFYRIVAVDSRVRRNGKYLDKIGHYNPIADPAEIVVDEQKALHWLKRGAIPTDTVKSIFSRKGIMLKWHFIKQGYDEAKATEEYKKWELLQLERQKKEEALAAQAKRAQQTSESVEEAAPETEQPPAATEPAELSTEAETATEAITTEAEQTPEAKTTDEGQEPKTAESEAESTPVETPPVEQPAPDESKPKE